MKKATDYDEKHKKTEHEMMQIEKEGGCYTMDELSTQESKIANDLLHAEEKLNEQEEYFEHQEQILEYAKNLSEESKLKIEQIFEANKQNSYKKKIKVQLKKREKAAKLL